MNVNETGSIRELTLAEMDEVSGGLIPGILLGAGAVVLGELIGGWLANRDTSGYCLDMGRYGTFCS